MTRAPSLFRQLVVYLLAILFLGTLVESVVHVFFMSVGIEGDGDFDPNDYVVTAVRDDVIKSIARRPDGALQFDPGDALKARVARTPTLRFAVLNSTNCEPLSGSSPDPRASLLCLQRVRTAAWWYRAVDDSNVTSSGTASLERTPFGPLIIDLVGYRLLWSDLPQILWDDADDIAMHSGPVFVIAAVIAWFAVRRGLKPLTASAQRLSHIDMDSLNQRLPEGKMPVEIKPFITAVNEALTRLDAGVARQRRFIANAAHQLCTPIAILRARLDDPDDESLRRDQRRDLRRLQAIVEQLLVSARISERGEELEEHLDLALLVRSRVSDYVPLARENGRSVEFEGPPSGVMRRGYRQALESIIDNLVDNALRAEPVGGVVIVHVAEGPSVRVIDHGEGVAERDRKMIFEPFWRKSEDTPGAGLGLAIARELVELHGGRISVEETPGGGATFKVTLPAIG
ncbi:MAG: HAMP domain-containing sensor histidine kinase [Methylocystis sp.]